MPALTQLIGTSSNLTLTTIPLSNPVVEPLDGPTSIDDVFDRFPEEVYQQGRDTHLYRFLTALGGDSGAGLLKTQAYASRLQYEAELLNFTVLDQIYAGQFGLRRLRSETYPDFNPDTDALVQAAWDIIQLADQSYRQRCLEFFTATRLGTSPLAMAMVAQAGSGTDADVVENYRYIFDQLSDMPLGLNPFGSTVSTSEFIVLLRSNNDDGSPITFGHVPAGKTYVFTPASLSGHPATGTGPSVAVDASNVTDAYAVINEQDVVRNTVELLDRLRPTATLATIRADDYRYVQVAGDSTAYGSSERVQLNRLVVGQETVPWPATDPTQNFFIQSGVENETGYYYGSARELPIIFLTIENANAYIEAALNDALYGTNDFYDASSGISDYDHFRSEFVGNFSPFMQAIFPFLSTLDGSQTFIATNAIAIVNTPLILEGAAV